MTNNNAEKELNNRLTAIAIEIRKLEEDLASFHHVTPTWGDVGELGYILKQLKNINGRSE